MGEGRGNASLALLRSTGKRLDLMTDVPPSEIANRAQHSRGQFAFARRRAIVQSRRPLLFLTSESDVADNKATTALEGTTRASGYDRLPIEIPQGDAQFVRVFNIHHEKLANISDYVHIHNLLDCESGRSTLGRLNILFEACLLDEQHADFEDYLRRARRTETRPPNYPRGAILTIKTEANSAMAGQWVVASSSRFNERDQYRRILAVPLVATSLRDSERVVIGPTAALPVPLAALEEGIQTIDLTRFFRRHGGRNGCYDPRTPAGRGQWLIQGVGCIRCDCDRVDPVSYWPAVVGQCPSELLDDIANEAAAYLAGAPPELLEESND